MRGCAHTDQGRAVRAAGNQMRWEGFGTPSDITCRSRSNTAPQPDSFDLPRFRESFISGLMALGYPGPLCERLALRALVALQDAHAGERIWVRSKTRAEAADRQGQALLHRGLPQEIAQATGYSVRHVYRLISRARKMWARSGSPRVLPEVETRG